METPAPRHHRHWGPARPAAPEVASPLIVSTGHPLLQCHHRLFLDVLDLSGQAHVAVSLSLWSGGVSVPGAWVGAALPSQPPSTVSEGWKLLGVTQH